MGGSGGVEEGARGTRPRGVRKALESRVDLPHMLKKGSRCTQWTSSGNTRAKLGDEGGPRASGGSGDRVGWGLKTREDGRGWAEGHPEGT